MSKRFVATEIWTKQWYMNLAPIEKCAFNYIKDNCDNVGVWTPNFDLANFQIGGKIDWKKLPEKTNGNIEVLSNGKWWLPDFCDFQYGKLSWNCKPHRAYITQLKKYGLLERVSKGFLEQYGNGNDTLLNTEGVENTEISHDSSSSSSEMEEGAEKGFRKGIHTLSGTLQEKEQEKELEKEKEKEKRTLSPEDLIEKVRVLLEPYTDHAESFTLNNRQDLINFAARDGPKVLLGALRLCLSKRVQGLEYFVKDYTRYKNQYVQEVADSQKELTNTQQYLDRMRREEQEARDSQDPNLSLTDEFQRKIASSTAPQESTKNPTEPKKEESDETSAEEESAEDDFEDDIPWEDEKKTGEEELEIF